MTLNKIKAGLAGLAIAGAVAVPMSAQAADPVEASGLEVSGTVAFTTDYRFRGLTQTDLDPAAQGSIDLTYGDFYAGIWGSNIDFATDASVEIDLYGGYTFEYEGIGFDIGGVYYLYPNAGDAPNAELDFFEAYLGLSYDVGVASLGLTGYYSPEFTGEVGDAYYIEGSVTVPLFEGLEASAALGYQSFDNPASIDYTNWNIGVTYALTEKVSVDVRYNDTDLSNGQCAGITGQAKGCSETIIGTISASF